MRMLICVLVSLCLCSYAQQSAGQIQTRSGVDPSQFTVEVSSSGTSMPDQRIAVGSNGRFELPSLTNGSYNIRVVDERGSVVGVSIIQSGSFAPIEIRVTGGIARGSAVIARAVSLESLRADPDGKAEREFR